MTLQTELDRFSAAATLIAATKQDIKEAIETSGITVGTIPFDEYPARILLLNQVAPTVTSVTINNLSPLVGEIISYTVVATPGTTLTATWSNGFIGDELQVQPSDDGTSLTVSVTATNTFGTSAPFVSGATAPVVFQAPTTIGTIADINSDENATPLVIDVSPFFRVPGDPQFAGVTWSATGGTISDDTLSSLSLDLSIVGTTSVTVTATNSGGSASQTFDVIVGAADTTPPVLSGATNTSNSLGYVSNENTGTFYWMVDGTAVRTGPEVVAGGGDVSGSFVVDGGTDSASVDMSALSGIKWVHVLHEDAATNPSRVISSRINVIANDLTAPIITVGAVVSGITTAERSVSTDEGNGTLYWLVDGNTSRNPVEVKAAGQSRPVTATGQQAVVSVAGLTANTGYNFHVMHEDAAGNPSTVDSEAFTTATVGMGVTPVQAIDIVSSSANLAEYSGNITIGSGANRAVVAFVHGFNETSETVDSVAGTVSVSLGGTPMQPIIQPELCPVARCWSAVYWLPNPSTGVQAFVSSVTRAQRAFQVTLVELTGAHQTVQPVFTAPTISSASGVTLDPTQEFPTRTLASSSNVLLATASIDTGAAVPPTAIGGTMLLSGQTGPLGTSDVTHAVAVRYSSGVLGFQLDDFRRGILHMIEIGAA